MPDNNNISSTPYDDVFHTLVVDCTDLMIPVVNEYFTMRMGLRVLKMTRRS
jgi:hypothetical protein